MLLNKLDFIRNYPRDVCFGSVAYGGLGIRDVCIEAGSGAITLLIRRLQLPGQIQDMLIVLLNTWQYTSGLSKPLLQYPNDRVPHLEAHYFSWIPNYLKKINGSLEIANIRIHGNERENYQHIMDLICKDRDFTTTEVCHIRYITHFLQVHTISDMTNAAGTAILPGIMQGYRDQQALILKLQEIAQPRPTGLLWKSWKKFLHILCHPHSSTLHTSLGTWHVCPADSVRLRPSYYSPRRQQLFQST